MQLKSIQRVMRTAGDSPRDDALVVWLSVAKDSGRDRFTAENERFADRTGGVRDGVGCLECIDAVFQLVGSGD